MMKKLFLIVGMLFSVIQAEQQAPENDDEDRAFNELIYSMGMSLAHQKQIADTTTAKEALSNVYQEVEQVSQIVDLFLQIDEELVEHQITTIDALIDYEMNSHANVVAAGILWLSTYQDLFMIFIAMHPGNASFEVWEQDMDYILSLEDGEVPTDQNYLDFWNACCAVMQAQDDFEDLLQDLE